MNGAEGNRKPASGTARVEAAPEETSRIMRAFPHLTSEGKSPGVGNSQGFGNPAIAFSARWISASGS